MTLTDREYQQLRDERSAVIRKVGVETGGSNIQFASSPRRARRRHRDEPARLALVALASKATGFPIAKIAAQLAVGYTLDEIRNDITQKTPPVRAALDYVVVKIPRWPSRSSQGTTPRSGTQMKSVGEVMAIGRTYPG
jgi:carbamoyl-phosphate synthase large subunit